MKLLIAVTLGWNNLICISFLGWTCIRQTHSRVDSYNFLSQGTLCWLIEDLIYRMTLVYMVVNSQYQHSTR